MQKLEQRKLINLVDADKCWRKNLLKPTQKPDKT